MEKSRPADRTTTDPERDLVLGPAVSGERELVPTAFGAQLTDDDLEVVVGGLSVDATRSLYRRYFDDD